MLKVCSCCKVEFDDSQFSRHLGWIDNTCKKCRCEQQKERYREHIKDEAFIEKERERGREKYKRLNYKERMKTASKIKKQTLYPNLRNARRYAKTLLKNQELHHWNYNISDELIVLDRSLHHSFHTTVSFNIEEGIYYKNGEKLDTLDKHLHAIQEACEQFGYDYNTVYVLRW